MQPDTTPNGPVLGGSYVPYFYASGLYRLHGQPSGGPYSSSPASGYGLYDFSRDLPAWHAQRQPQTVEGIIQQGYFAVPSGQPETALIHDRAHTSRLGLDDVIGQVRQRHALYRQNMYELDQSVCEANNAIFRQEAAQGHPADNRQRYAADKAIRDVYEQKRAERVKFWQDISRLRQTLPEAAQLYLAAYRKLSILRDVQGDGP